MHLHVCVVLMLPHHSLVVNPGHTGKVTSRNLTWDHVLLVSLHVLAALPAEFIAGVGIIALLVARELLTV